jgi:hypothetical protein
MDEDDYIRRYAPFWRRVIISVAVIIAGRGIPCARRRVGLIRDRRHLLDNLPKNTVIFDPSLGWPIACKIQDSLSDAEKYAR